MLVRGSCARLTAGTDHETTRSYAKSREQDRGCRRHRLDFRAANEENALRIANETRFGLGSSIWSKDVARAEQLAEHIQAGCTFINGMVKSDPRLPFGGVKSSGYGRELSKLGIHEFVNAKTVWIR